MARGIVVKLGEEESTFEIRKVDREKLYGRKERVVVDEKGRPCSSAWLTADGVALVPAGGTAFTYVDETFEAVERSALKAVDLEGKALAPVPSTLGTAQKLVGPVPPERVLDLITSAVYELSAETIGEALRASLARGDIYETRFNYREDYHAETLIILQNEQGIFGLVGDPHGFGLVRKEQVAVESPAEDEDAGEDLDFAMM